MLGMAWRTARPWQARLAELATEASTEAAVPVEDAGRVVPVESVPVESAPVESAPVESAPVEVPGRVESRGVEVDPVAGLDPAGAVEPMAVELSAGVEALDPVGVGRPAVWEAVA